MTDKNIPTIGQRRKQSHDDTVRDILLIAREMMRADGVAALSFNGIARRLGIKPPSLYTYFPSKHAIYDALFRRGFQEFADYMDAHMDRASGLEGYIHSIMRAYMAFALENPDLFQLMFQRPIPGFEPSDESMAVSLDVLERMRQELQSMLAEQDIQTNASIEATGDLLIAMMHGLGSLQLANNPEMPVGEGRFGSLVDHAVGLFMQAWSFKSE